MKATLRSAVAIATLLVSSGLAAAAQQSPVGTTWDCLISGSGQQGIAFLTFSNDFTFTGYQLLTGKQKGGGTDSVAEQRNSGGDVGRGTDVDVSTPSSGSSTLFGFGAIEGPWRYDENGRVIGYFVETLDQQTTITTNQTYTTEITWQTNWDYTVTPPEPLEVIRIETTYTNLTFVTNTIATTNAVSFTAKVVPGKRLNLVSSTPNGKVSYRGRAQQSLPAPISGSWYAAKKKSGQSFVEFFKLDSTIVPNLFVTTNGTGPDSKFGGVSMVSVTKKIGFAFQSFTGLGTNEVPIDVEGNIVGGTLSASFGPVNYPKKGTKANTKGFEEPDTKITFQAVRQGP